MRTLLAVVLVCFLCAAAFGQNAGGNGLAQGGAKIEQALLSTPQPGASFTVSPKGVHMATLTHSGSRMVIIYDGVEGPKFDEMYGQSMSQTGVIFSPDGNRWAYCGRQGSEFVVMVDAKEYYRSSEGTAQGVSANSCAQMAFTSNGQHLYFFSSGVIPGRPEGVHFVWDGKPDPLNLNWDLRTFAFSPDGNHVAYHWSEPTNRPTSASDKLVVDGKAQTYFGGSPLWSPDSQHLFTFLRFSNPQPHMDIMLDGKPFMRADNVRLFLPPMGPMWIAQVDKNIGVAVASHFLVLNGKMVPGSEMASNSAGIGDITFSPDGKHYAAIMQSNQHMSVFADGKRGLEYDNVQPFSEFAADSTGFSGQKMAFTSESGKVVYIGYSRTGDSYLVIGDQESNSLRAATWVAVSPAGGHVLAAGQAQVAYDGKMVPLAEPGQPMTLAFSPDGMHYAFGVAGHNGLVIYLDGVPQSQFTASQQQTTGVVFFSPDSKHLAYFCNLGNDRGVCVDGKFVKADGGLHNLTFSADSNHLYWNMVSGSNFRLFVDGKPVMDGALPLNVFAKETWQVDGNTLLLLCRDNTGYKRLSITPAPGSGLQAMLGQTRAGNTR